MDRSTFLDLLDREFSAIREINVSKGHDYAGDDDALSNFYELGDDLKDISDPAFQAWFVYFSKHWSAVKTYLQEEEVKSEPIEGRIRDCILYLHLLHGLIEEKRARAAPTNFVPTGPTIAGERI